MRVEESKHAAAVGVVNAANQQAVLLDTSFLDLSCFSLTLETSSQQDPPNAIAGTSSSYPGVNDSQMADGSAPGNTDLLPPAPNASIQDSNTQLSQETFQHGTFTASPNSVDSQSLNSNSWDRTSLNSNSWDRTSLNSNSWDRTSYPAIQEINVQQGPGNPLPGTSLHFQIPRELQHNGYASQEQNLQQIYQQQNFTTQNGQGWREKAKPELKFVYQPADEYRFRYKSEMEKHGRLMAQDPEKYPTVQLTNFHEAGVKVEVKLYTYEEMSQDSELHRVLRFQGKEDNTMTYSCSQVNGKQEAVFTDIRMITLTKDNILTGNKLENEAAVKIWNKYRNKDACLRVVALHNGKEIAGPIYSSVIRKQKNDSLKIVDVMPKSSSGNEEVWLLTDKVMKKDILVKLRDEETGDEEDCQIRVVHHQYAIICKIPEYKMDKGKTLKLFLYRPKDGATSAPWDFKVTPRDCYISNAKRKRNSSREEAASNTGSQQPMFLTVMTPQVNTASNIHQTSHIPEASLGTSDASFPNMHYNQAPDIPQHQEQYTSYNHNSTSSQQQASSPLNQATPMQEDLAVSQLQPAYAQKMATPLEQSTATLQNNGSHIQQSTCYEAGIVHQQSVLSQQQPMHHQLEFHNHIQPATHQQPIPGNMHSPASYNHGPLSSSNTMPSTFTQQLPYISENYFTTETCTSNVPQYQSGVSNTNTPIPSIASQSPRTSTRQQQNHNSGYPQEHYQYPNFTAEAPQNHGTTAESNIPIPDFQMEVPDEIIVEWFKALGFQFDSKSSHVRTTNADEETDEDVNKITEGIENVSIGKDSEEEEDTEEDDSEDSEGENSEDSEGENSEDSEDSEEDTEDSEDSKEEAEEEEEEEEEEEKEREEVEERKQTKEQQKATERESEIEVDVQTHLDQKSLDASGKTKISSHADQTQPKSSSDYMDKAKGEPLSTIGDIHASAGGDIQESYEFTHRRKFDNLEIRGKIESTEGVSPEPSENELWSYKRKGYGNHQCQTKDGADSCTGDSKQGTEVSTDETREGTRSETAKSKTIAKHTSDGVDEDAKFSCDTEEEEEGGGGEEGEGVNEDHEEQEQKVTDADEETEQGEYNVQENDENNVRVFPDSGTHHKHQSVEDTTMKKNEEKNETAVQRIRETVTCGGSEISNELKEDEHSNRSTEAKENEHAEGLLKANGPATIVRLQVLPSNLSGEGNKTVKSNEAKGRIVMKDS